MPRPHTLINAFFHEFRQSEVESSRALEEFCAEFQDAYRQARSHRVRATPHFDVLRVFGLEYAELRHSDVLA